MRKEDVHYLFSRLREDNPNPEGELNHTNPYTLLVAVMLSAQATDKGVNRATKVLFEKVKTPEDMVKLGEVELTGFIKTIGLFRAKAKNIIRTSEILIEKFNGSVPDNKADLVSLPGVGDKTANVVLNMAFGVETFAVDTHVFRVSNRTGLAAGKTTLAVEKKLEAVVPKDFRQHAHHWLILHGRYICKARTPLCHQCPITAVCDYYKKETKS